MRAAVPVDAGGSADPLELAGQLVVSEENLAADRLASRARPVVIGDGLELGGAGRMRRREVAARIGRTRAMAARPGRQASMPPSR